ncbi:MAG TPA: hypothetical protein VK280_04415 [Streptosporangiaceae bacterium]|nr:hypothetical protein [Streptosporangiaceae bacterium]
MTARLGDQVTVIRGGGRNRYPVEAVVELFAIVVFQGGPASAAVVRVTESAGLYREGNLFVARASELEPARVTS